MKDDCKKTNVIETANRIVTMIFPLLGVLSLVFTILYNNANRPYETRIQAVEAKTTSIEKKLDTFPSKDYFDEKFKNIETVIGENKTDIKDVQKDLQNHIIKDVK